MTCPACGAALDQITEHCPACHAIIAPRLDGALAPDPSRVTPPARPSQNDADQGSDAAWRDEVNERVRQRRKRRGLPAKLPLFPDAGSEAGAAAEPSYEHHDEITQAHDVRMPAAGHALVLPTETGMAAGSDDDDPLAAISLRGGDETEPDQNADQDDEPEATPSPRFRASFSDDEADSPAPLRDYEPDDLGVEEDADDVAWNLGLDDPSPEVRPLERPATVSERVQAAVVDLAILSTVAAAVVYFSFKAAQVGPLELLPAWPYLLSFVGFFGLLYAAYFTGISGCTPGKTAFGLRVVDTAGRAPGIWRAGARALIGAASTLVVVGALPIFFDPARRTLPDRVFRTRVIRL